MQRLGLAKGDKASRGRLPDGRILMAGVRATDCGPCVSTQTGDSKTTAGVVPAVVAASERNGDQAEGSQQQVPGPRAVCSTQETAQQGGRKQEQDKEEPPQPQPTSFLSPVQRPPKEAASAVSAPLGHRAGMGGAGGGGGAAAPGVRGQPAGSNDSEADSMTVAVKPEESCSSLLAACKAVGAITAAGAALAGTSACCGGADRARSCGAAALSVINMTSAHSCARSAAQPGSNAPGPSQQPPAAAYSTGLPMPPSPAAAQPYAVAPYIAAPAALAKHQAIAKQNLPAKVAAAPLAPCPVLAVQLPTANSVQYCSALVVRSILYLSVDAAAALVPQHMAAAALGQPVCVDAWAAPGQVAIGTAAAGVAAAATNPGRRHTVRLHWAARIRQYCLADAGDLVKELGGEVVGGRVGLSRLRKSQRKSCW